MQNEIHDSFKEVVRRRRGDLLSESEDVLFSGEFWTGRRAEKLGLIDGIGDLRSVMRRRFGEHVRLKLIGGSVPWWRRRTLMGALPTGERLDRGLWAEDLIAAVESRALWSRFGL